MKQITYVKDGNGHLASCHVWKDCYAQGGTINEAISEITSVAASLIEVYREENKAVPSFW